MSARGAHDLKLAYEKPLLAFGMSFNFSRLGLLFGLCTVNAPWAVSRGKSKGPIARRT